MSLWIKENFGVRNAIRRGMSEIVPGEYELWPSQDSDIVSTSFVRAIEAMARGVL